MKHIENKPYFSTSEVAGILGISRVAVFQKIKKGQLRAEKFGRNYLVPRDAIEGGMGAGNLTEERKKTIDLNIDRIVKEYGEALRMLGRE